MHCRPRTNPALLRELDTLERQRARVEAEIARLEMAVGLMREGGWRLERTS